MRFTGFFAALYAVTGTIFYLAITQDYRYIAGFDSLRIAMFVVLAPLLVKYVFQLACAPFYSLTRRRRCCDMRPSVSVLIPAWNEEVGILKTIRSVLDTKYPDLQMVVINDGSTDGTHEVVTGFMQAHAEAAASMVYLNLRNGGKARAMNRGLQEATGEIVVTIDADSVMDPAALERLVPHFSDSQVGGVAGNVVVGNRSKPIEWIQQMEYLYGFFFKRADSLFNSVYIIGGAAAAYRRSALEAMGGFDHTIITEDIEMSTRMLAQGWKTRYAHDAVVYTEGPAEWGGLCNQRLRWKYGRILTFIKHRKLFFNARPGCNPYLSWMLLPVAVYAEILLFFEALLLSAFFVYTAVTRDYMPLVLVIALLSAVVLTQIAVDPKRRFHRNLIFMVPVAWLVFYLVDLVECQALVRSLKRFATGKKLQWQKWARLGIGAENVPAVVRAYSHD